MGVSGLQIFPEVWKGKEAEEQGSQQEKHGSAGTVPWTAGGGWSYITEATRPLHYFKLVYDLRAFIF